MRDRNLSFVPPIVQSRFNRAMCRGYKLCVCECEMCVVVLSEKGYLLSRGASSI